MIGMGIPSQPENPFWKIQVTPSKAGVCRNPLAGHWAPNAATPDYVATHDIRLFLAYGFIQCYNAVHPDYFTMWNMVQVDDVQWLRGYFLRVVEKVIDAYYKGDLETGRSDFDHGVWGQSLNIGNGDEGDDEEVMYTWAPEVVQEDAIGIALYCDVLKGEGTGESEVIWLNLEALRDRREVRAAIKEARKANNFKMAD